MSYSDFNGPYLTTTQSNQVTISDMEFSILRSDNPIEVDEHETITVLGQQGIWLNRNEVKLWKGDIPIDQYQINEDPEPQIINKMAKDTVEYVQELVIRYLKPPTPSAPGEIIFTQEPDYPSKPAPPLIIRQQPPRPLTPEPLVIREKPPQLPQAVGVKRITISGKRIPPPPRKVIIERFAPLPSKPQNVIIERWLPYKEMKRRVLLNRATETVPKSVPPKNVIVQWEVPQVNVRKEIKYLGVIKADPIDYVKQFGPMLNESDSLPSFVTDIKTPSELGVLASKHQRSSPVELEGELEAFRLVDLDQHGLSQYREYLAKKGIRDLKSMENKVKNPINDDTEALMTAANQLFSMLDIDRDGTISLEEAQKIILHLNSRLSRSYGEIETMSFFDVIGGSQKRITRENFLNAFNRLSNQL